MPVGPTRWPRLHLAAMEVGARMVAGFVVVAMVEVGAEAAGKGAVESA